jgi:hypothetical protein
MSLGTGYVSERNNQAKNRAGLAFLLGLTAVALYLCYVLIAPFLKPIFFSAVLTILFYSLRSHILCSESQCSRTLAYFPSHIVHRFVATIPRASDRMAEVKGSVSVFHLSTGSGKAIFAKAIVTECELAHLRTAGGRMENDRALNPMTRDTGFCDQRHSQHAG